MRRADIPKDKDCRRCMYACGVCPFPGFCNDDETKCKRCGDTGQVDDPAAGNSNMLTMMPCPDCD